MTQKPRGALIIIGGHEDKVGDQAILKEIARRVKHAKKHLVIVTVATQLPEEVANEYIRVFKALGVHHIKVLDIRTREDAVEQANVDLISDAAVVFFTGGDQLRITSQIGDSLVFQTMQRRHEQGGTIVGTSAGAAAMSETMLVAGSSDKSHTASSLDMAPGLGFIDGVVIDSHFAERGRISRLLSAVAQNPKNLGVGIDEDTAILVDKGEAFQVIGSGAVYVIDGAGISYSNLSEAHYEGVVSVADVKLHVLGAGDRFDLIERRPLLMETALPETSGHSDQTDHH